MYQLLFVVQLCGSTPKFQVSVLLKLDLLLHICVFFI